jgi:hypothetical protein|tara:strand:+ start:223 stop:354 length:132 start_codon:yes stop_codon:yes gene_type:complete
MTMVGDEEAEKAVMERIEEHMDNMTQEDWERVFETLCNREPPQ